MRLDKIKAIPFAGRVGDASSLESVTKAADDAKQASGTELNSAEKSLGIFSGLKDLAFIFSGLPKSKTFAYLLMLTTFAVIVLVLNVTGELRMNKWQGDFYRAIEQKNISGLGLQALTFVAIMSVLLTLVVTQNWLIERLKIKLREWLSHHLLDHWMKPNRAYRMNMSAGDQYNPDQRIQEDARYVCETSADLGVGFARCSLMLACFVGVLWVMSDGIVLSFGGRNFTIPGYMVWFAVIYAGLGSWLASVMGRPLIRINNHRYAAEADFRYSITRVNDNAESIAFYNGEKDEREIINNKLMRTLNVFKKLSFANARMTTIGLGHGWLVVILPVLVALPGYLQGKLDFGSLMMVVGAFNHVQHSMRWFVDSFALIASWRSAVSRVRSFKDSMTVLDQPQPTESINLVANKKGNLSLEDITIKFKDGKTIVSDASAQVSPGERVLLIGESGSGKSTLLRAIGGLWPWGNGKIQLPPAHETMFLPQKPYIPLGTLATSLAYPHGSTQFTTDQLSQCLRRVNLETFIPKLYEDARWDRSMSLGQQQRFAFARLLLHRPNWVFLDEATSALDGENQELMMNIFNQELKASAVLTIGHRSDLAKYHDRVLYLTRSSPGRVLTLSNKPRSPDSVKTELNFA